MKITRLELMHVRPRWVFLKVHTDRDIVGLGEPSLEGRAQTVAQAVRELEPMLIGEDPRRIEHLWQRMYRQTFYRGGPVLSSAISGVDQALWDILGKSLGVPVHQLLGGRVRDRIRMYGWIKGGATGDYIDNFIHHVEQKRFTAYKFSPIEACRMLETPAEMERAVEMVARVRETAGPEIDIAIDMHGRTTPALSRRLAKKLEPYDPLFMEEPVLPGDTDALVALSRATSIPLATGERLYSRWDFQDVIQRQAVAVVQPDLSHACGVSEVRRIAAMAESRNIAMAPHCPLGPIALAACLQVDAATPNFLCQEHVTLGEGYLREPFVVNDGYIEVPTGPGLGIALDEKAMCDKLFAGDWQTPTFELPDGSITEW